jgi:hypothetical protein
VDIVTNFFDFYKRCEISLQAEQLLVVNLVYNISKCALYSYTLSKYFEFTVKNFCILVTFHGPPLWSSGQIF